MSVVRKLSDTPGWRERRVWARRAAAKADEWSCFAYTGEAGASHAIALDKLRQIGQAWCLIFYGAKPQLSKQEIYANVCRAQTI